MAQPMPMRKTRNKKSETWLHFVPPAPGEIHVTCKYCEKKMVYKGSKKSGLGHLQRHIEDHCQRRPVPLAVQQAEAVATAAAELLQPSAITTATEVVAVEAHQQQHLHLLRQVVPTAADPFHWQRGAQVSYTAAVAVPNVLHAHVVGEAEEGTADAHSATENVHRAAASSLMSSSQCFTPVDDAYEDDYDTMLGGHLRHFNNNAETAFLQEKHDYPYW